MPTKAARRRAAWRQICMMLMLFSAKEVCFQSRQFNVHQRGATSWQSCKDNKSTATLAWLLLVAKQIRIATTCTAGNRTNSTHQQRCRSYLFLLLFVAWYTPTQISWTGLSSIGCEKSLLEEDVSKRFVRRKKE